MDACQQVGADKVASGVGVQRDIVVAHGAAVRVGANSVALGAISHPCASLNGSKVVAEVGDDSIADCVGSLVWRSHLGQKDGAAEKCVEVCRGELADCCRCISCWNGWAPRGEVWARRVCASRAARVVGRGWDSLVADFWCEAVAKNGTAS